MKNQKEISGNNQDDSRFLRREDEVVQLEESEETEAVSQSVIEIEVF